VLSTISVNQEAGVDEGRDCFCDMGRVYLTPMHPTEPSQNKEAVPVPSAPRLIPIRLPIVPTFVPADLITPPSTAINDATLANEATLINDAIPAADAMSEATRSAEVKRKVKEKVNLVLSTAAMLRMAFSLPRLNGKPRRKGKIIDLWLSWMQKGASKAMSSLTV
jgi:hypothetical protein